MSRTWRVAILGLGHWYSAYGLARALPEYPNAELVAAAWHDATQLDAFTKTFGVPGYANYDELLARERVDIVHIASPVSGDSGSGDSCSRGRQAHGARQAAWP